MAELVNNARRSCVERTVIRRESLAGGHAWAVRPDHAARIVLTAYVGESIGQSGRTCEGIARCYGRSTVRW